LQVHLKFNTNIHNQQLIWEEEASKKNSRISLLSFVD
jgi:hypothetical protein